MKSKNIKSLKRVKKKRFHSSTNQPQTKFFNSNINDDPIPQQDLKETIKLPTM